MDDFHEWKNKWDQWELYAIVLYFFGVIAIIWLIINEELLGAGGVFFIVVFGVITFFLFIIFHDPYSALEEQWRPFCSEIGAEFVRDKSFFNKSGKAVAKAKDWTITFDTFIYIGPNYCTRETHVKASFVSKDGFRFKIYQSGLFRETRKLLGMQDIEIGHPMFDLSFVIESNDKSKVRELFADTKIRQLIQAQPSIELGIKTSSSRGMDELYFLEKNDIIIDVKRLKSLYELFAETLNKLHHIGSA